MCGIAGCIGSKIISKNKSKEIISIMKRRGPDHQDTKKFKLGKNKYLNIFFSRLKIIDLSDRANQPYFFDNSVLIFNGEIYNYLEIKKTLIFQGYNFTTNSDTEVLIKAIHFWGEEVFKKLEGMWAFFFHDFKKNKSIISRDRFGEKPLFYFIDKKNFYFGSEINYIKKMKYKKFKVNYTKVKDFLYYGYKCLFKDDKTFFKEIYSINAGEYVVLNNGKIKKRKKYYNIQNYINKKITYKKIKNDLINSIKLRLRSDVPMAHLLSGGVDSNAIASLTSKKLKKKINTFSFVSKDNKYDETKNINLAVKSNQFNHKNVFFDKQNFNFFSTLNKLTFYYNSPVYTTTSLMNYQLMKTIKKKKIKVVFSGIGGDEIFSGYYHHYLINLSEYLNSKFYKKNLYDWKKYILPLTRNKLLQKEDSLNSQTKIYKYIYQNFKWKKDLFINKNDFKLNKFKIKKLNKDKFINRLMNELLYETVPVVLCQDDLNAMYFSIENRSPLLDSQLIKSAYSFERSKFIKNGYAKSILREISKKYINKKIVYQREKIGFNLNLKNIINYKNKNFMTFINRRSKIYSIVKKNKIIDLLKNKETFDGEENNFLFNFISCKKFIENFG